MRLPSLHPWRHSKPQNLSLRQPSLAKSALRRDQNKTISRGAFQPQPFYISVTQRAAYSILSNHGTATPLNQDA